MSIYREDIKFSFTEVKITKDIKSIRYLNKAEKDAKINQQG